jgi:hypothetical protein
MPPTICNPSQLSATDLSEPSDPNCRRWKVREGNSRASVDCRLSVVIDRLDRTNLPRLKNCH